MDLAEAWRGFFIVMLVVVVVTGALAALISWVWRSRGR